MSKIKSSLLALILIMVFSGCGDNKFDGSENSITEMMKDMPSGEKVQFIKDFELVAYASRGEKNLVGFNVEDLKNEALKVRKFAKNKNVKFLKEKIDQMKSKGDQTTYLHINYGIISNPKQGYNYKNTYSINDLEDILLLKGDYEDYEFTREEKRGFIKGCLQTSGIITPTCECIWTNLSTKYSSKDRMKYSMNPTVEYTDFMKTTALSCFKKIQGQ